MSGVAPTTPPELLGSRRSTLVGRLRPSGVLVAALSTLIVFGVLAWIVVNSPGWPRVQQSFFSAEHFYGSLPSILRALWKNIQLFLVAEALIDAGVLSGLPRPVSRALVVQTLLGSARLLAETGDEPERLRAAVTSPGGTTAAGLAALEAHAIRSALIDAVVAATERSRELGSPRNP